MYGSKDLMNDTTDEQTQTLLILGAGGDLTTRLLLPGLGGLVATSSMDDLFLVGSGRSEESDQGWQAAVARAFADGDASGPAVDAVVRNARYMVADATDSDDRKSGVEGEDGAGRGDRG